MTPFLSTVATYIHDHHPNETGEICVVLPNKRGALYLKQHLAKLFTKTIWLPVIISAEELVEKLSGLQQADSIDLMCDLYVAYMLVLKDKAEPFDAFSKWGSLMLQDFNECDRYLTDTQALYQNLKEIKDIENWSLGETTLTNAQEDYCTFMLQMGDIYAEFGKILSAKKQGYQGLMYRQAVQSFKENDFTDRYKNILICGFNALNKAEIIIFSDLVKRGKAKLLWDTDEYYVANEDYEAGLFLRENFKVPALKNTLENGTYFKDIAKNIEIVAVPKQVGQAQVVSQKLESWFKDGIAPNKIAIVLADESLLFPVLAQLPAQVEHVNVTMEYPLRLSPLYDLVENIINLHQQQKNNSASFYFKDVFKILQNSFFKKYYSSFKPGTPLQTIIQKIIDKNYVWINEHILHQLFADDYKHIKEIFVPWPGSVQGITAIQRILDLFNTSGSDDVKLAATEQEYLHVFTKYFNRLQNLILTHSYLNSLTTLKSLYKQIIGTATVPFIGEPLQGLQIMGVLETRTLDFENIILLGVNEGVLPSGKSVNSFIPNDLKRHYGMPLYGHKDAVYAYHFYRLLQRATNVFITYNTEQSVLGTGEKSRFLTQLQFELNRYNPQTVITEQMLGGGDLKASLRNAISFTKTPFNLAPVISKLTTHDEYNGLSPSALIAFKDCSLRFYFRYGTGIKETDGVEENVEANTQGTILHETLEILYKPFISRVITVQDLAIEKTKISSTVDQVFKTYFTQKESEFGKNFLQKKVVNEYVSKLLLNDSSLIKQAAANNQLLTLIDLEKNLSAAIPVTVNNQLVQVYIKGSADRIDRLGDKIRVIDYKTSVHAGDKFIFTGFEDLFTDSHYNKMLQLFVYAWLVVKNQLARPEELQPCIIPFKKFEKEPRYILSGNKSEKLLQFTNELLQEFEARLTQEIETILNPDLLFSQTTDLTRCDYCAYARICNVQ